MQQTVGHGAHPFTGRSPVAARAGHVARHRGFQRLARIGILSRALVYLVLSGLIIEMAVRGHPSAQVSTQGAFDELARQPAGPVLLAVLGAGLLAYAGWRFVQGASGQQGGETRGVMTRLGWATIGLVYVALCVDVARLIAGSPPKGGPPEHPGSIAATVLRWPAGPEIVGALGLAVAGAGVGLMVWAALHDEDRILDRSQMSAAAVRLARVTGIAGECARGLAVTLVGVSLLVAGVSSAPSRAKSVDAALQAFAADPLGRVVLVVVGVGFLVYSARSVLEARFRRP